MEQQKRQLTVADALKEGVGRMFSTRVDDTLIVTGSLVSIELINELPGPCSYPNMLTLLFI